MASIKAAYTAIDIHRGKADAWPESIPELTGAAAINAVRRLYRFSLGERWKGDVELTSGNRRAFWYYWDEQGRMFFRVNPSQGWRELVHDMSHVFDYLCNGETTHSKHHARFEAKLVREVIKRGWLEGEPAPRPKAPPKDPLLVKLERVEARIVAWQSKLKRAENALKKLGKEQKRAISAHARGPVPKKPRRSVRKVIDGAT